MVGSPNSFRKSNTAYRRQQFESYRLSQQKSGRGAMPEENYDEEYVIHTCRTSRPKLEIRTTIRGTNKMQRNQNRKRGRMNSRRNLSTKRTNHKRLEHSRTKMNRTN